jgi:hypothetical protein
MRKPSPFRFPSLQWPAPALVLASLALALLPALPALAQVEEEDLDQPGVSQPVPASVSPVDLTRLFALFAEAETLFRGADQQAALPLLAQIVDPLEAQAIGGRLDAQGRQLLAQSLAYRAQIQFNFGEDAEAAATMGRLLEVDASYEFDPNLVSPKLLDQFLALRRQKVGQVSFAIDPPDAVVTIDGQPVDGLSAALGVLAGSHTVAVRRPGHEPMERQLEVEAGKTVNLEIQLARRSAVLRVQSRPTDAEVVLDGNVVGRTAGAATDREGFSAELVVDGVETGYRVLEVRKPGFRTYRAELTLDETIDYPMPPIVLEPESGKVVLTEFPAGARITVDGQAVQPDVPGASRPSLTLAPGQHHVLVAQGSTKMFSTRFDLADRQTVELNVKLRPGLAFLGVLGQDRVGADAVLDAVRRALASEGGRFTVIEPGNAVALPGLDAATLRAADAADGRAAGIDWPAVQRAAEQATPALLYAVAVLSNDLVAEEATLWVWAAAPGPSRPDRLRLKVGDPAEIERLRAAFDRAVEIKRPYFGALAVNSAAAPHPLLIDVTPESPAAKAGLQVGDLILGVAGTPVQSRAELEARWRAIEPGETVDVAVSSPAGARTVKLTLGSSPLLVVDPPVDFLPTVAYAQWTLLEERTPKPDLWVVQANIALLLLRGGDVESGVRKLRAAQAPQASHGVGQTTLDYFLGQALLRLGDAYRDTARAALERAAQVPGARLDHNDGAYLQPRARSRLQGLDGG